MDFEIWDSRSGNMLLSTPDLNEALTWAFNFWLREGEEALAALSIGDERDRWVVAGGALRELLFNRMWHAPAPWVTAAGDLVVDIPVLRLSPVGLSRDGASAPKGTLVLLSGLSSQAGLASPMAGVPSGGAAARDGYALAVSGW